MRRHSAATLFWWDPHRAASLISSDLFPFLSFLLSWFIVWAVTMEHQGWVIYKEQNFLSHACRDICKFKIRILSRAPCSGLLPASKIAPRMLCPRGVEAFSQKSIQYHLLGVQPWSSVTFLTNRGKEKGSRVSFQSGERLSERGHVCKRSFFPTLFKKLTFSGPYSKSFGSWE